MLRRLAGCLLETTAIGPVAVAEQQPVGCVVPAAHSLISMPFLWLNSVAPRFPIQANQIDILRDPTDFYATIVAGCKLARQRITLATLYIGGGRHETEIVDAILNNAHFQRGCISVRVLLDCTRGCRPGSDSRSVLMPLLKATPLATRQVAISLYHTPELRGLLKSVMPTRLNEVLGLQHMKIYIFDNTLIVSGANLSHDYFVNRQDRYFVIRDKSLCDFYCGLVERVQRFSLQLASDNTLNMSPDSPAPCLPYKGDKQRFIECAGRSIRNYIDRKIAEQQQELITNPDSFNTYTDTYVYPLVQMSQLGIYQDSQVTQRLLSEAPSKSLIRIASGYFNLTTAYMRTIIEKSQAKYEILMAHSSANGFYGAQGLSAHIPNAYALIAQQFERHVHAANQYERINLWEYLRGDGWTFHAKGLWYFPEVSPTIEVMAGEEEESGAEQTPYLTMIGSPNLGMRSVYRDLETQLVIVSTNRTLRMQLDEEWRRLWSKSVPASTDLKLFPWWLRIAVHLFRQYF